jgi:hypothetical protein
MSQRTNTLTIRTSRQTAGFRFYGRDRRKRKSEAACQSDFATFDSTLADERLKTNVDGAEYPRMRLRQLG